jgi:proline iminopeptidase
MTELYSEIEPYDHGRLDVGDGNLVYWETCGHPYGKPAVVLVVVSGAGHSSGDPGMSAAVIAVTDRFAARS